jgi:hypothetical protein
MAIDCNVRRSPSTSGSSDRSRVEIIGSQTSPSLRAEARRRLAGVSLRVYSTEQGRRTPRHPRPRYGIGENGGRANCDNIGSSLAIRWASTAPRPGHRTAIPGRPHGPPAAVPTEANPGPGRTPGAPSEPEPGSGGPPRMRRANPSVRLSFATVRPRSQAEPRCRRAERTREPARCAERTRAGRGRGRRANPSVRLWPTCVVICSARGPCPPPPSEPDRGAAAPNEAKSGAGLPGPPRCSTE